MQSGTYGGRFCLLFTSVVLVVSEKYYDSLYLATVCKIRSCGTQHVPTLRISEYSYLTTAWRFKMLMLAQCFEFDDPRHVTKMLSGKISLQSNSGGVNTKARYIHSLFDSYVLHKICCVSHSGRLQDSTRSLRRGD